MITQQNIINHELTGMNAKILDSANKTVMGLSGEIMDETSAMLFLATENGIKMIAKKNNIWEFTSGKNSFTVNGNTISKRPEDRLGVKA